MNSFIELQTRNDLGNFFPAYIDMSQVTVIAQSDDCTEFRTASGMVIEVRETPERVMELWQKHVRSQEIESAAKWGSNSGTFDLIRTISRNR